MFEVTPTKEMPFLEHLAELRERLLKVFIGLFACSIASFFVAGELFELLAAPLKLAFSTGEIIGTGPADAFVLKLQLALAAGFLLSLPMTFYQIWGFVAPGLHAHEKRLALPFVFACTLFFLCGVSFCFAYVLPVAFDFFAKEYLSVGVTPAIRIGDFLSFTVKLLLVFGVVFELPVISYFLARFKLLTAAWLMKHYRYIVVGIFCVAAVLTPGPDVASQLLLAAPMMVLYGLCIAVAFFAGEKQEPRAN